jgi:hypothetical protein
MRSETIEVRPLAGWAQLDRVASCPGPEPFEVYRVAAMTKHGGRATPPPGFRVGDLVVLADGEEPTPARLVPFSAVAGVVELVEGGPEPAPPDERVAARLAIEARGGGAPVRALDDVLPDSVPEAVDEAQRRRAAQEAAQGVAEALARRAPVDEVERLSSERDFPVKPEAVPEPATEPPDPPGQRSLLAWIGSEDGLSIRSQDRRLIARVALARRVGATMDRATFLAVRDDVLAAAAAEIPPAEPEAPEPGPEPMPPGGAA